VTKCPKLLGTKVGIDKEFQDLKLHYFIIIPADGNKDLKIIIIITVYFRLRKTHTQSNTKTR